MQNIHVLQAEGNLIWIQLELHFYTEMGRKEGDRKVSNIVGLHLLLLSHGWFLSCSSIFWLNQPLILQLEKKKKKQKKHNPKAGCPPSVQYL